MHRPEQVFSGFRQALAHLTLLALSSAVAHASAPAWIVQDEGQAILPAGTHAGLQIDTPLRLTCAPGALIDAGGQGHALRILASDVRVEGCTLRNWGRDLTRMDSGIFIERGAQRVHLVNNDLHGPGFGIWADRSVAVEVRNNRIQGDPSIRSQDRGNGIHLFGVTQARIIGNQVWHTRDGIYIETAHHNRLEGNHLHDLRYGIHYMYSHSNAIINNRTERTRTGYALMQSKQLEVIGNRSWQDQNYGILLNYITHSTLRDNQILEVQAGTSGDSMISGAEGKALFIYNSLFNRIENNLLGHATLGIHLTAGSEDNRISGNSFMHNQQQVKYVATRLQEWSVDGRGNYWSDYLGWDRNADGLGDVPYEPNDNVDRLLWTYPQARLLMHSPAVETLRWVQQAFPVMRSPGVRDSAPLMRSPHPIPPPPTQRRGS